MYVCLCVCVCVCMCGGGGMGLNKSLIYFKNICENTSL